MDAMNVSRLRAAIIEQFAPRFLPHAKSIYARRAAGLLPVRDDKAWQKLGLSTDVHPGLPDVIFYAPSRRQLYLVECGPISLTRYQELEAMFKGTTASRVYVSTFAGFREFSRHGGDIAWETRVWIAEVPDHLIHYDGGKVMPPRRRAKRKTG